MSAYSNYLYWKYKQRGKVLTEITDEKLGLGKLAADSNYMILKELVSPNKYHTTLT